MRVKRRNYDGWPFVVVYSGLYVAMLYAVGLLRDPVWAPLPALVLLLSAGGLRLTFQRWRREPR